MTYQRRPSPEEDATFLSQITWWWQNGQIWNGWRKSITYDDLADLNSRDKSEVIVPLFQKNWNNELENAGSVAIYVYLPALYLAIGYCASLQFICHQVYYPIGEELSVKNRR